MTPEKHNKALGICHLAYGALSTLFILAMLLMFGVLFMSNADGKPPTGILLIFALFMLIYSLIFTLPSFIAGYAMLKHKPWARKAGIVAAVLEVISVPLGTAVGVYSFWFLFSDAGKAFYDKNFVYAQRPYALYDAPPPPSTSDWNARTKHGREHEYVPPTQPPDWRGQ